VARDAKVEYYSRSAQERAYVAHFMNFTSGLIASISVAERVAHLVQ
jgi:hypothetical protein